MLTPIEEQKQLYMSWCCSICPLIKSFKEFNKLEIGDVEKILMNHNRVVIHRVEDKWLEMFCLSCWCWDKRARNPINVDWQFNIGKHDQIIQCKLFLFLIIYWQTNKDQIFCTCIILIWYSHRKYLYSYYFYHTKGRFDKSLEIPNMSIIWLFIYLYWISFYRY